MILKLILNLMAEYHKRITIFYCHKAQQKYGTIVSKNSSSIHRFWLLGSKSLKNVLNWKRLLVCLNANKDLQRLLDRKTIRFLVLLKRTALSAAADIRQAAAKGASTSSGKQGSKTTNQWLNWYERVMKNTIMLFKSNQTLFIHHFILYLYINFEGKCFYFCF